MKNEMIINNACVECVCVYVVSISLANFGAVWCILGDCVCIFSFLPPSFFEMSFISSSALADLLAAASSSSLSVPVPAMPLLDNPAVGSNLPFETDFSTFL